ncbi:DNA-directed DNA polymerase alpha, DNA primase subunit [Scheffersomyces xylosifermentans]|uniref:DNA-directed DNA polymerase alpha, DNA primase subunit n=1 Tax=Scheffersomyces xylosifermentans TaxID=1304137 RepID=UPI00315C8922
MFRSTKRRTAGRRNFEEVAAYSSNANSGLYSSRLSFYDVPPLDEITLEEFEMWAIDRLKILIEIESCVARSKSVKEIESTIKPMLLKYLPLNSSGPDVLQERKKDHYSHYILRLVFCRTEELRKKFIKNETQLFKVRYNLLQPKEQQEFVDYYHNKLSWKYISSEEKSELFEELYAATGLVIRGNLLAEGESMTNDQLKQHIKLKENFIKLPFEKVPNLVGSRSIFIKKGYAYIPTTLQLNLLAVEFQESLSTQLMRTFQSIPRLDEDDRLLPLLNNLSHNFSSVEYNGFEVDSSLASDINASSIATQAITKHYPLCASHLQRNMMDNSHLRFTGRQQLALFLKGIGLSIDEAMKFWSYQFTKNPTSMTIEKFNKEYRYNIRHTYGLEGARTKYQPWNCANIMAQPKPLKGEYHGCPYRDLGTESLIMSLNEMGIHDQHELNQVMEDVDRRDYTVACTRVFELTHKQQLATQKSFEGMHISHPNLYFDRSRQLERSENKTVTGLGSGALQDIVAEE